MGTIKLRCWHKGREAYLEKFYVEVGPYQGTPEPSMEVYEEWLDMDEGRPITDSVELRTEDEKPL